MSRRFKPGDRVKIKHTEELLDYFKQNEMDINSIFVVTETFENIYKEYPIHCKTEGFVELGFHPSELYLYIKDNAINRLLYPELKPDGEGYLIWESLK